MIVNNYWKWLSTIQKYGAEQASALSAGLVNTSGSQVTMYVGYDASSTAYNPARNTSLVYGLTFEVGMATEEITDDSYRINNTITVSEKTVTMSPEVDGGIKRTFFLTGRNGASAVTIRQVALVKSIQRDSNPSNTENVMLAAVDLETPLIVPAYGTFSIALEWTEA